MVRKIENLGSIRADADRTSQRVSPFECRSLPISRATSEALFRDGILKVHHINQKMAVNLQINWMDRDYDQIVIILYCMFKFIIQINYL